MKNIIRFILCIGFLANSSVFIKSYLNNKHICLFWFFSACVSLYFLLTLLINDINSKKED